MSIESFANQNRPFFDRLAKAENAQNNRDWSQHEADMAAPVMVPFDTMEEIADHFATKYLTSQGCHVTDQTAFDIFAAAWIPNKWDWSKIEQNYAHLAYIARLAYSDGLWEDRNQ